MRIPYGLSSFSDLRRGGFFYADKTTFLPQLESAEAGYRYVLFLRPRRMGKSLLLSMMEHYYDVGRADEFDTLFGGLWIHDQPTPEKNKYLVLSLDFSMVSADGGPDMLRRSFFEAIRGRVLDMLATYGQRVPTFRRFEEQLQSYDDPAALLGMLTTLVKHSGYQLYVLIDEYDNFANSLLSAGDEDLYSRVVERTGFVRAFYRTLKAGTQTGAIARIFMTGVSPILLDDLTSGFNIAYNVTQDHRIHALAGFTREEVDRALDEFLAARPGVEKVPRLADRATLFRVLEEHYDGYRFSREAKERVFNSDMVLYFLRELDRTRQFPREMLDPNVRTDYTRLQRLGLLSGAASEGRRRVLTTVLSEGHIEGELVDQFGAKSFSTMGQFLSILFYTGMLTIAAQDSEGLGVRLEIPNLVIRELSWSHMARLLEEQESITLDTRDLDQALRKMAVDGDIEPFLDLFHSRVIKAVGLKDLRQLSEKAIKLMMLAFISLSRIFHPLSEKEFAQGYCDLFLGVSRLLPTARVAWLLELKYLPTDATPEAIEAAFTAANAQLARYTSDANLVPLLTQGRGLRSGTLVFVGAQTVTFRPFDAPAA